MANRNTMSLVAALGMAAGMSRELNIWKDLYHSHNFPTSQKPNQSKVRRANRQGKKSKKK